MRSSLVASCLVLLVVDFGSTTGLTSPEVQDGQVQTVEAVLGHGLTLQCHLPDMEDKSGLAIRWQRWATHRGAVYDDAELTAERVVRRRRHHRRRSRRLIHQSTGSALRFASISEEDEGLYRCVASSTSSSVDNIETSVDDEGRDQSFNDTQNDRHSLVSKPTLDQLDVDNATSVSAINDVEQQSGEAAALTSSITATDTTSTVYGSFIYLRIQVAAVLTDYPESPVLIHPLRQQRRKQRLKCLAFGHPTPVIHWRVIDNDSSAHQDDTQQRILSMIKESEGKKEKDQPMDCFILIHWSVTESRKKMAPTWTTSILRRKKK